MPPKQYALRPKHDQQSNQRGPPREGRGDRGSPRGGRGGARGGYVGQENRPTAPMRPKPGEVPEMKSGQFIYEIPITPDPKNEPRHAINPTARSTNAPGNKFRVKVNYFKMKKYPTSLVEYSVVLGKVIFGPDGEGERSVTRRDEKKSVLNSLQDHSPFKSIPWAHSITSVWVLNRLKDDNDINIPDVLFMGKNGREERMDNVRLVFVAEYQVKELETVSAQRDRTITGLNAFVATAISRGSSDIFQIGSNKFFCENGWTRLDVSRGTPPDPEKMDLLAYRGYFFSTRITRTGLYLNVNTTSSAFFAAIPLSTFMRNFGGQNMAAILPALKGLSVRRTYDVNPGKDQDSSINSTERRIKRITEFGLRPAQQPCKYSGGETTVADYYRAGGLIIRDPELPCVNVGAKHTATESSKGTWIPAEFLEILPHQPYTRLLDGKQTKNMLDVACKRPPQNLFLIMNEGMPKINLQQLHPGLGLDIELTPTFATAKKLTMPTITYQGTEVMATGASWKTVSNDKKVFYKYWQRKENGMTKSIDALYILDLYGSWYKQPLPEARLQKLYNMLVAQLYGHGLAAPRNPDFRTAFFSMSSDGQRFKTDLESALQPQNWPVPPTKNTFLLVILPAKEPTVYATVKAVCDSIVGINSICCQRERIIAPESQYLSNIALKFTFKLGGDVHHLRGLDRLRDPPNTPSNKRVLVMGADVTHPQAGSITGCPSIAGVVGSLDQEFMRFPGSMRLNPSRQERIESLEEMVTERLQAYYHANMRKKPNQILFYRDGVSESQYEDIQKTEIQAIKSAYTKWAKSLHPDIPAHECVVKLTFIVVGKRHNTRFYPGALDQIVPARNAGHGNPNVGPGFVVDTDIVMAPGVDFFLQSHTAIKGTARPAHYIVLENGMGLKQDELHKITHEFCFAYARATLGVSYCAPAYYADRLCERGRCFLRRWLLNAPGDRGLDIYAAPKFKGRAPAEQKREMENHRASLVERISRDPDWNPRGGTDRKNPWHPHMDNILFYL